MNEVKFPPDVIVFDSIVFTIGTGMEEHAHFGVDFIYAKKCIKELCPYAKINDVISNPTHGFHGVMKIHEPIHSIFSSSLYPGIWT